MIKNSKWLSLLSLSMSFFTCYSQASLAKGYLIITCEQKFAKSFEGVKRTFWILPEDSISNTNPIFSPVFFSGYFQNDIDSCRRGRSIDPYFSASTKDNYLDTPQKEALDLLQAIVFTGRKKVQTIMKTWASGNQEQTTIYATSVSGSFCCSKFNYTGQKRSGYNGLLYIPYSQIAADDKFWDGEKGKIVMHIDFSRCDLSYNVLYNIFPEWRKYGK